LIAETMIEGDLGDGLGAGGKFFGSGFDAGAEQEFRGADAECRLQLPLGDVDGAAQLVGGCGTAALFAGLMRVGTGLPEVGEAEQETVLPEHQFQSTASAANTRSQRPEIL
jgi:hypothetical protein